MHASRARIKRACRSRRACTVEQLARDAPEDVAAALASPPAAEAQHLLGESLEPSSARKQLLLALLRSMRLTHGSRVAPLLRALQPDAAGGSARADASGGPLEALLVRARAASSAPSTGRCVDARARRRRA